MTNIKYLISAFIAAFVFGLGLGIGGMTLPAKVIGFLDITGNWDPSLAFVMLGAVGAHSIAYRLITKRQSPLFDHQFHLPTAKQIDRRLLTGSFLFGIGWGLGGFCPGPSIVSAVTGHTSVLTFVASMIVGIYAFNWTNARFPKR